MAISSFDSSNSQVTALTPENKLVVYAGTGHSSNARRGGPAIGLLKSIDGGTNWSVVGAQYLAGLRITSIVTSLNSADKDLVLVGAVDDTNKTGGGLYRSADGGTNWTPISNSGTGLLAGSVTDIAGDPGNQDRFYAAVAGDFDANNNKKNDDSVPWENKGLYWSDDKGANWHRGTTGIKLPEDTNGKDDDGKGGSDGTEEEGLRLSMRILLDVSPAGTGTHTLFAGILDQNLASDNFARSGLSGVFRSTDAGVSWSEIEKITADKPQGEGPPNIHQGDQGRNNFSLVCRVVLKAGIFCS